MSDDTEEKPMYLLIQSFVVFSKIFVYRRNFFLCNHIFNE